MDTEPTTADVSDKPRRRRSKRLLIGCLVSLAVLTGLIIWALPFRDYLFGWLEAGRKRTYSPLSCMANLKELSAAFNLYLDENDQYPPADRWMDIIRLNLHTADMSDADQEKKLRCPALADDPQAYGYAFNDSLSLMLRAKVTDEATTVVVFDSENTIRNAHAPDPVAGAPKQPRHGDNNALFADGHVGVLAKSTAK